ncbi:MAG: response regulator [Fibrobacteria bacterium]|nr:response regulator [Fibrobacteria bacterium]
MYFTDHTALIILFILLILSKKGKTCQTNNPISIMTSQKKILIVEDDKITAEVLADYIKKAGYVVCGNIGSGNAAVQQTQKTQPDLILIDINLSGKITGIDATERIQKFLDVPVIFTTGQSDPATIEKAVATHPYGYLLKPISYETFRVTIESAFHRHDLNKRLETTNQTIKSLTENLREVIYRIDYHTRKLLFISTSIERLSGYTANEFLNNPELKRAFIHPDDKDEYLRQIENYHSTLSDGIITHRIITKTGKVKWVEHRITLEKDSKGKPTVYNGIIFDITSRVIADQKWKKSFDSIHEGMFIMDQDRTITHCNKALTRLLEKSAEEIISQKCHTICHGENKPLKSCVTCKAIDAKKSVQGEVYEPLLKKYLKVSADPVYDDDNNFLFVIHTMEDITEQKMNADNLKLAMYKAESSSRAKSQFLANMSHEIRTPMNGVLGMSHLLLNAGLDSKQMDFAKTINESARELLGLINDILDYSKLDAGKMDIECTDFDLRLLLDNMYNHFSFQTGQKGLDFTYSIAPEVPSFLKGDPSRLRQLLNNYVSNAVKFTDKGTIAIHVKHTGIKNGKEILRFEVNDTGIGIQEDSIPLLFESFSQVDESFTRKYKGTGLGLAICKQISMLMDGEVGVESKIGEGSCFWFTVVLERQHSEEKEKIVDSWNKLFEEAHVLIADSNKQRHNELIAMMNTWGCKYESATNVEMAIKKLKEASAKKTPFKVVIADKLLPNSGAEELGTLIKNDIDINKTRLIMLASTGERGDALRARRSGFNAYLTEPFNSSDIFNCLNHLIAGSDKENEGTENLITRHSLNEARKKDFRILLAEDNNTNRFIALKFLENLGYIADEAIDGRKAVEAIKQKKYDLVFMDIQMPELDGFEATRIIREQEEKPHSQNPVSEFHLPIVAMTAHSMQGDRERCLEAGMDDYISKPILPEKLEQIVNKYYFLSTTLKEESIAPPVTLPETSTQKPVTSVDDSTEIFNDQGFLKRNRGHKEIMQEMVNIFTTDAEMHIVSIEEAIHNQDCKTVREKSHALKGASATISAVALQKVMFEMEMAAKAEDLQKTKGLLESVKYEFGRFKTCIQKLGMG